MLPAAERAPCSTVSLAADEPLAGTASRYRHWLLVEQPGRWGHDALVDSGFPEPVGRALRDAARRLHLRVLLIKRRDRERPGRRRCFVAFTGRERLRLATFEVDDVEELASLDLRGAVRDGFEGIGEPVDGPLFLVCTHGKHDACCARLGVPLYRAISAGEAERTWEATHVGGDRFAGNVVCFPDGLYFGRIPPEDGLSVVRDYARGEVDLRYYRGRSSHPPAVQAAEHHVRSELGIRDVRDVVAVRERADGEERIVEFETPRGRRVVRVRAERLEARRLTCKAEHPHRPRRFVVTGMA